MKSSCPEYVQHGDYPSDDWLEAFEEWNPESPADAAKFLLHDLPLIMSRENLFYGSAHVGTDRDGDTFVCVSTGGWSGCESVMHSWEVKIYARMTLESYRRGGHYVYVVPASWQKEA